MQIIENEPHRPRRAGAAPPGGPPPVEPTLELVHRALAGERRACRLLVGALTPVVHTRVAQALLRSRSRVDRDLRQEVADIVQTILLALFKDGGRALLSWDPARLPLKQYVAIKAERDVVSILRSRRLNPWTEAPTPAEELDEAPDTHGGPELQAASREMLRELLVRLRAEVTELGWQMFTLLYVEGRTAEDVGAIAGMTVGAVYAWRSRLTRLAKKLARDL
jgi:DNA-directed RNA polymerase specialized sigma24 family protein